MSFSILMSVYKNSKINEVIECFNSLEKQTIKSDDWILVLDGPVEIKLEEYLTQYSNENKWLKIIRIEKNVGLGLALRQGMDFCKYNLIARMDTDDICASDRFEKQLKVFQEIPTVSVIGSNILEFIDDVNRPITMRVLPESNKEIKKYLKKRCPFNHMTVMFKRTDVLASGGYLDWHYDEDSYLWVRMHLNGYKFYNIQENLVFARINNETFLRRGGYKYYLSEKKLFKFMKDNKVISLLEYFRAVTVRYILYVLLHNKIRKIIFINLARKRPKVNNEEAK